MIDQPVFILFDLECQEYELILQKTFFFFQIKVNTFIVTKKIIKKDYAKLEFPISFVIEIQ